MPVLQAKYPTVFVGIGKGKDYKLKLHIDSEVAQKTRRVPFPLREKVTAKVEDLTAKDIVERVNRRASWVSPRALIRRAVKRAGPSKKV